MRFQTIYLDPPWPEIGGGVKGGRRGADRHYDLMSVKEIMALPVKNLVDTNCHIYCWATANYLDVAIQCLNIWGFRYKRPLVWVKSEVKRHPDWRTFDLVLNNPGLGQYFRGVVEICLFGVKGVLPYKTRDDGKRAQGIDVYFAPRTEHSAKPEEVRRTIELVSHPPYLEMFARRRVPNWDLWGNEVEQTIVIENGVARRVREVDVTLKTEIKAEGQMSLLTEPGKEPQAVKSPTSGQRVLIRIPK